MVVGLVVRFGEAGAGVLGSGAQLSCPRPLHWADEAFRQRSSRLDLCRLPASEGAFLYCIVKTTVDGCQRHRCPPGSLIKLLNIAAFANKDVHVWSALRPLCAPLCIRPPPPTPVLSTNLFELE